MNLDNYPQRVALLGLLCNAGDNGLNRQELLDNCKDCTDGNSVGIHLKRLKEKFYVSNRDGRWSITQTGREALSGYLDNGGESTPSKPDIQATEDGTDDKETSSSPVFESGVIASIERQVDHAESALREYLDGSQDPVLEQLMDNANRSREVLGNLKASL